MDRGKHILNNIPRLKHACVVFGLKPNASAKHKTIEREVAGEERTNKTLAPSQQTTAKLLVDFSLVRTHFQELYAILLFVSEVGLRLGLADCST